MSNKEIAVKAVLEAEAIISANQIKSSEFVIRVQNYRNTVVSNLSPKTRAQIVLEDSVRPLDASLPDFDAAVELLEACSAKHNLNARI